jgi:LmbE family N-acetylglucosaminyl deacetylase
MKKLFLLLSYFLQLAFYPVSAQQTAGNASADIYQGLRKLNVLGSVLYVAAHPDDENTRLITYLSKDKLYRTGYLSMTRGDGGQNLIGNEQGIDLGLIRTQELLAARRVDGGEQFFTRAFDFGFSKTPEETFTKWHKEKILADVVWVIRKFQPDIVITRFPTTGEGGHGHHTASAILANEAFEAAADPNQFPEQLKYVKIWQTKRVLWNTFNFGGNNTTREDQFKVDVGGYNALLGKSYGEISAESRSQHKSQGFGVPATRGEAMEFFKATKGDQPATDLLEGTDLTWKRVSGGDAVAKMIDELIAGFDFIHPEKSVKGLVKLYQSINALPAGYWKDKKLKETLLLIQQCTGLFTDVTTREQFAVQTDSVKFLFALNNRLGAEAQLKKITVDGFDTVFNLPLLKNKNLVFDKTIFVPPAKPVTQPYWLESKMEEGYYNVKDPQMISIPDIQPAYMAKIIINIEGQDFSFDKPVKYKFTDPVKGELYQPLVVVPPVTFEEFNPVYFKKSGSLELTLKANTNIKIPGVPAAPKGANIKSGTSPYLFGGFEMKKGELIAKSISDSALEEKIYKMNIAGDYSPEGFILRSVNYDHIPSINYYKEAILNVKKLDVKTYNKKIGYIIGAGDKVPEALEQMGYEVTLLTDKELSRNNLERFDAIITGVRAYNTNEKMSRYYDKLMKYVNDGGNLIVQYNTNNFISTVASKIGPYPFTINRTRVTDENAQVTFLKPEHPVLNFPNKITQNDFNGWIQERSIYHAAGWDKNFETIFSMNDAGEKADEGSLIIAKYGKGYFTYTGLVFFRELPAGVPGAYRLLANIIALNKKKGF